MHAQHAPGPHLRDYDPERKHEERVAAESTSGCKQIGGGECEDTSYEDASIDPSSGPHLAAFPSLWKIKAKKKGYEALLDAHNDAQLHLVSKYSKPCALKCTASGQLEMRTKRNPEKNERRALAQGLCGMRRHEEALHAMISKAEAIEM
ncbi:hypothetical protein B0H13DRAFT_1919754 [Mycena leptocephala]|nr:hypothetical protein B0H13DRAFT_1919754 [Mycena leptocephala]